MKKKIPAALCAAILLLGLVLQAAAAGEDWDANVIFLGLNDSPMPLNDSTMPIRVGGTIYVPYTTFVANQNGGIKLGVFDGGQNKTQNTLTLFNSDAKNLTFDLRTGVSYDYYPNGERKTPTAIIRNGQIDQKKDPIQESPAEHAQAQPSAEADCTPEAETAPDPLVEELEALKNELAEKESKYLRLAAEYDNFRKRSQKEKESAYADAKTDAVSAFLPVYDNLERALKQETCDEAYAKGVEMTMTGLKEIMTRLGIEEIPALGQPFDPSLHNAVMHVEDESAEENTVVEVFQAGFRLGEKVIRFAMVKVAN